MINVISRHRCSHGFASRLVLGRLALVVILGFGALYGLGKWLLRDLPSTSEITRDFLADYPEAQVQRVRHTEGDFSAIYYQIDFTLSKSAQRWRCHYGALAQDQGGYRIISRSVPELVAASDQ